MTIQIIRGRDIDDLAIRVNNLIDSFEAQGKAVEIIDTTTVAVDDMAGCRLVSETTIILSIKRKWH